MIGMSIHEAAQAMRARIVLPRKFGDLDRQRPFPGISIDSRTLRPGECFFAIRGPRLDGHEFISSALEKGASIIIASRRPEDFPEGAKLLLVDDTTQALQDLARYARLKWGKPLVAITGSAGKTSTRHFTAGLLSRRYQVHSSPGNLNNEYGVPLSLGRLSEEDEISVQELGMNHAGEIRQLVGICRPDAAVVTNVAPVHTEYFDDLGGVAAAKAEILEGMDEKGRFFYNADDPRVSAMADDFPGEAVGYGLWSSAQVRVTDARMETPREMLFNLEVGGRSYPGRVHFSGLHNLYNLAAAAAVAMAYGISPQDAVEEMEGLELMAMRGNLYTLNWGEDEPLEIWDDSYNSNPKALASVLDTVSNFCLSGRRILVLGDMLELGDASLRYHRQAGAEAAALEPDLLIAVGPESEALARGALEAGLEKERVHHFEDAAAAAGFLLEHVRGGDFLLVKGSRGVGLEAVIQALKDNPPDSPFSDIRLDGIQSGAIVAVLMFMALLVSVLAQNVN
ncbi:MAG TPA: UDP-N-acetylmuramoyl-tripeptide--D-alanyl-D-alanine ligase [Acidobacteriota bacterium]|nr:UDP-N-acetylmuramoyl-tripeptide--D-alanyl-D-alanine ligase [Acidobacteriota bacterium]